MKFLKTIYKDRPPFFGRFMLTIVLSFTPIFIGHWLAKRHYSPSAIWACAILAIISGIALGAFFWRIWPSESSTDDLDGNRDNWRVGMKILKYMTVLAIPLSVVPMALHDLLPVVEKIESQVILVIMGIGVGSFLHFYLLRMEDRKRQDEEGYLACYSTQVEILWHLRANGGHSVRMMQVNREIPDPGIPVEHQLMPAVQDESGRILAIISPEDVYIHMISDGYLQESTNGFYEASTKGLDFLRSIEKTKADAGPCPVCGKIVRALDICFSGDGALYHSGCYLRRKVSKEGVDIDAR